MENGLYSKLAKIRKLVEVVQKNERGFNYSYASITDILAKLTAGMNRFNVMLVPKFIHGMNEIAPYSYTKTRVTKTGEVIQENITEILTQASMFYTWIDLDSGETLDVPWVITGSQQDPAQAMGSALTYGLRQFITQFFQIAQPKDDPDNWRSAQKAAAEEEDRKIAAGIVENINAIISAHLKSHPDDREEAITIVKKYAKEKGKPSGNPNAITDPVIAGKLFEEISGKYGADQ